MNNFIVQAVLNFSIAIPVLVSLVKYRRLDNIFNPFLWLLWLGMANEVLSLVLAYTFKSNAVNANIYILFEYGLILYQFYNWNFTIDRICFILAAIGVIIWIADNLVLHSITYRNSGFRIFESFTIVFLSINEINKMIVFQRGKLYKNPIFLICITFLIYYSYKAFVETFALFDLGLGDGFSLNVFMVLTFVNFISNILYAISILCIPPKLEFTLPY